MGHPSLTVDLCARPCKVWTCADHVQRHLLPQTSLSLWLLLPLQPLSILKTACPPDVVTRGTNLILINLKNSGNRTVHRVGNHAPCPQQRGQCLSRPHLTAQCGPAHRDAEAAKGALPFGHSLRLCTVRCWVRKAWGRSRASLAALGEPSWPGALLPGMSLSLSWYHCKSPLSFLCSFLFTSGSHTGSWLSHIIFLIFLFILLELLGHPGSSFWPPFIS